MNQAGNWIKAHPRLTAWIVLAVGMNAMVIYEARSVGLLLGQWAALIVATTLVAGLCVWIIGWEDDEDDEQAEASATASVTADGASTAQPDATAQKPTEPAATTSASENSS
jgi:hypothetical protein